MNDYFIFPINFEDIQQQNSSHHYVEQLIIPSTDKQIKDDLDHIDQILIQNYQQIIKHQNFDYIYHLIKLYSENIQARSMKILQKISESLRSAGKLMLKEISKISSSQSVQIIRVCYKMTMFLILFYVTAVAKCKLKTTQADMIVEAINKEKRKKNKGGDIELSRVVIQNMKQLINIIKNTLDIDYRVLWQKKYTDVCVKILESSLAKEEEVIQQIFCILEVIIKQKSELFMNIQRVLINLVYQSGMTDTLVNFFSRAESPELQRLCTETVICVVVYLVAKNLNSQASSIKNTKQFLSKLSQKIPKVFYNNLSCFIRLYLHESYHLRNAISDILMNILRFVLNNQSDQSLNKARQKFINTLIQRIYDKSSFCRWHVLGILNQLTIQKIVPKKYMIMFLKAGVDRIKDISVNTRKKALQLINSIIEDVWPQDRQLRSISVLKQQIQMISLSKQTAEQQVQQIKNKIEGQDYQSQTHLQKMTKQMNILFRKIHEYQRKQTQLAQQQQVVVLIQDVLDKVKILLSSKTDTDVLETIRLFIKFYKRNIQYCKDYLPNIRLLIFSKQKKIKDQVLMTFTQLHLIKRTNEQVVDELIGLFKSASAQDQSALQQILQIIISQSLVKNIPVIKVSVYALLWYKFIGYEREQNIQKIPDKRAILTILRISFNRDPSMIKQQNVVSFLGILKDYIVKRTQDYYIIRQILKIIMLQPKTSLIVDSNAKNILLAVVCILVNCQNNPQQDWYSVSQHLLSCIYKISVNPEKLTEVFIKKLHENLKGEECSSVTVAHFIFTLAHSCLKMLIHLDSLENKIKAIKLDEDDGKGQKSKNKPKNENDEQQQLDKVVGGIEAQIQVKVAQIQKLGQKILQDPFINSWLKLIQQISTNLQTGTQLQIICVLSYCKFMCISSNYCQEQFTNLLKILNKNNIDSVIKNNVIIAIGDLLHRFPNIVEPYSRYLYQNLHDQDIRVRKTTLTVLTHLALNDMIKVKSDVCDIAMLFQDDDPQIQSLVKQFFSQVNRKDPKYLFNIIPQALMRFSQVGKMGEGISYNNDKTFTIFLQNVLPLMQKDKYSQSLVLKLCQRLSNSLNMLQIKNTAYCLSQINMNQKGLRKLIQSFIDYKKVLETPQILTLFKNLVTKLKKSTKGEIKSLVQQLQQKISNANQDIYNAQQIKKRNERNQKKQPKKKGMTSINKKKNSTPKQDHDENSQGKSKKKYIKINKKLIQQSSQDDSIYQQYDNQQSDRVQDMVPQSQYRNQRPKRTTANRRPIIVQESYQNQQENDQFNQ